MKRLSLFLALSSYLLALSFQLNAQERIMLISDPHVLAQSLVQPGSAFDNMMSSQRKMLDLSEPAWYALMDTALKYRPDLLLIPGDLTKDSELASHQLVINSLNTLREAGIPTLLIPGNHDIGGDAYAYFGTLKQKVENLKDAEWESAYSFVYDQVKAKDPNSHSFIAEPFKGVSVIGIDAAHDNASIGSLSDKTLSWILTQADSARAKGHMIIAMSHWQLLEHFDRQGTLESSCRINNADDIRDSLMAHGVRLVLTGHFHVNGITTYVGITDSIVEITTGSPITYPCPYRFLTLSEDRTTVDVQTYDLKSLANYPDLQPYSRTWMEQHSANMIPTLSLRLWNKSDKIVDLLAQYVGQEIANRLKDRCIPKTDSAKVALVQKYFGSTVIQLYLLHSDANEPEYPQADSLAQEMYKGLEGFIDELLSADPAIKMVLGSLLQRSAKELAQVPVQSLVEDVTGWASTDPNRTDDLHLALKLYNGYWREALDETLITPAASKSIINGTLIIHRGDHDYLPNGQEVK